LVSKKYKAPKDGEDNEEPDEEQQRDINKFLEDQKRFDEERKYKQMLLQ